MRVRGFDLRNFGEYRNGLRRFQDFNLAPEIANIERIELLKGPASLLYGISGPGGLLNVVTVVPGTGANVSGGVELSSGSFDFWRGVADVTVPISDNDGVSVRFTASLESTGGFQDFVDQDTALVSGALAWRPDDRTELVADIEYVNANFDNNVNALPADGVAIPSPNGPIPRSRAILDTNWNNLLREQIQLGGRLRHQFNDNLRISAGYLHSFSPQNRLVESFATGFAGGFEGPRQEVTRNARTRLADYGAHSLDINLAADWSAGGWEQRTVFGVDYYRSSVTDLAIDVTLPTLDLNNPVYGVAPISAERRPIDQYSRQQWIGLYADHQLIISDQFRLVAGARWSSVITRNDNRLNPLLTRRAVDRPVTWRGGAVWQPSSAITLFVQYSTSFNPVLGADAAGRSFEPEAGHSFEIGARTQLYGDRAALTVSFFDIERSNVTNADPDNPGFSIQTGRQRSRGAEVELIGEVVPNLSLTLAYAWLDTSIVADTRLLVGQPFQGVPEHNGSLFAKYRVNAGMLEGLGFGLGVFGESSRPGQFRSAAAPGTGFDVRGYVRADATLSYTKQNWEAALAVVNLTDRDYVSGVISRTIVYRGDPRTATLSVRRRF